MPHIPYAVPAAEDLPDRLQGVLYVIYLIFNEGYTATAGDRLVRAELCEEAIRLGQLLLPAAAAGSLGAPGPDASHPMLGAMRASTPTAGSSRCRIRIASAGTPRPSRAVATRCGAHSVSPLPGPFQLQAAIAALHTADLEEVPWGQIASLYAALAQMAPSPIVSLNHAAAVGYSAGPEAGLALLDPLLDEPSLSRYQPLYATQAELLRLAGDDAGARVAYERALALSENAVERDELERPAGADKPGLASCGRARAGRPGHEPMP